MFTGLIEGLATVRAVVDEPPGKRLVVVEPRIAAEAAIGESIAVSGCCLTVVSVEGDALAFQAGAETLSRTALGGLRPGSDVNLERSLRASDRLGGHFVTGHIDGVGALVARHDEADWSTCWFAAPAALGAQMASKGSIAVDGVSLTLVEVESERFSVALIPHTLSMTTLGKLRIGELVNLETDVLAKYVQRRARESFMLTTGTNRQTVSYLTRRFREVGIEPESGHGQNFLIDLNLMRLLVDRAELGPDDVVLEVGTGTGSLTALVAERAGAVVTVEVDPRMFQLASEELVEYRNVTMLHLDALRNKNRLDERVMAAVKEQLSAQTGRQLKLVANLPYNIATPVISNLLAGARIPRTMTVTLQKELADRMMARPSTKDYGALSIWVQCQCRVELVREMPPTVFWPRPKVTSAIVHLVFDESLRKRLVDADGFHRFVRSLFLHRRKLLRSVLAAVLKGQLSKPAIDQVLANLELGAQSRAEELDVSKVIELFGAVKAATLAND